MTPEQQQQLKSLAAEKGVKFVDRGNGHIQLRGPLLVNYYPDSKSRSAYVAGTVEAVKNVTAAQAIAMCFKPPKMKRRGETKDKRRGKARNKRAKLIAAGKDRCYWCGIQLTIDNSTLEHIIPLIRGGLDNDNNRALACPDCNHGRGHQMKELKA